MGMKAFTCKARYEMLTFILLETVSWSPIFCAMKGDVMPLKIPPALTLQDWAILFLFLGYEMDVYVINLPAGYMLWVLPSFCQSMLPEGLLLP